MLQCGISLSGCGVAGDALGGYDLPPETENVEGDWPRLADAPPAPPPGTYDASAPDPARGDEIERALATQAAVSAAQAEALSAPVISEAEARRLAAAAR